MEFLLAPLRAAPWLDWRGFWLGQVCDDRFLVAWFLPLVPLLILARRLPSSTRSTAAMGPASNPSAVASAGISPVGPDCNPSLRPLIIATGLAWLAYVFGLFYAMFWLGLCATLHRLAEQYARETQRPKPPHTPVRTRTHFGLLARITPHAAAWWILGGAYFASFAAKHIPLPRQLNDWLFHLVPFVFPLGMRGLAWEPAWTATPPDGAAAPQLFNLVFDNPHNIGIAYLAVRMLHYFAEIARGGLALESRSRLRFLSWTCYAPALMQGPLERFVDFQAAMDGRATRRTARDVSAALARIAVGIAKSVIATLYFRPLVAGPLGRGGDYYQNPAAIDSYALLYFGVYLQIFWLYLEFSGYCDVSAGIARLLGYRQVENFRMPWLASSMRDFWRRWHISLSSMLRDHVYIPLGGSRRQHVRNLCLTFALCGLWHAPLPRVAMWGALMGLMVAVHHAWHNWMERLDAQQAGTLSGLRRAWLRLAPLPQLCAWALTIHCFVMSLLVFFGGSGGFRTAVELLRRPMSWLLTGH